MQKALLLVVDVQRGFINENTKPVIAVINQLIASWRSKDWPVVCSRFINLPGSNWRQLRDWHNLEREPDTLLAENLQADTPYIFKKSTYTAWSNEVLQICQAHKVDDVVIAGIDTNECVLATALSVFDSNFTPWIVDNACASGGGRAAHESAIEALQVLLGKQQIITSQELL